MAAHQTLRFVAPRGAYLVEQGLELSANVVVFFIDLLGKGVDAAEEIRLCLRSPVFVWSSCRIAHRLHFEERGTDAILMSHH